MDQAPMDIYIHSISSPSVRPDNFIGWGSFPTFMCFPHPLQPSLARFISSHLISLQIFRSKCSACFLNARLIICSILLSSHTHISYNQNSSSVKNPHLQLYRRILQRHSWNMSQESLEMPCPLRKEAHSSFLIDSRAAVFCRIGWPDK
jgi:hypothetical protein